MAREFLGDEINMLLSDLTATRGENEQLKLNAARRDEENRIMRDELVSVRSRCEEMTVENAAIHIILESVGQSISNGLQRYVERRNMRRESIERKEPPEQRKAITSDDNSAEEQEAAAVARTQVQVAAPPVQRVPVPVSPRAAPAGSDNRMPMVDFGGVIDVDEDLEARMREAVKDQPEGA